MTDNDIIKALECCKKDDCDNCPNDFGNCYANLAGYALDIINRQQAEIKKLKKGINIEFENFETEYDNKIKAEAVKEFAEKVKKELSLLKKDCRKVLDNDGAFAIDRARKKIDNLVKGWWEKK